MAVSKLWPVTVRLATVLDYAANPEKTTKAKSKYSNADYQALRDVVNYVKDGKKTEQELFCQGINCNPSTAREQFVTVKEQFDKPDGIQAYHGYLSFKETDITPELAQHIGMEFANSVWGKRHQVLVTTHLNTEHLHCHFVINSVSFVDGKRCRETSWFKFYKEADRICEKYGISTIKEPERYARMSVNYENEQRELVKRVDEDEKRLVSIEQTSLDLKILLKVLRNSTAFEELTPTLVNSLIRRIEVHNNDKSSGHCSVKVDIYFTAIGLIDIPTEDEIKSLMEKIQSNPQEYRLTA